MHAVSVTDSIWWVGAIDWNLRDFHGFDTPLGSTYNAYLVIGEREIALVDTVKTPFVPEMLARVESVVPLDRVTLIVVNHVEPDHCSGLRAVSEACPNARIVASPGGVRGIAEFHGPDLEAAAVSPAEPADLGGLTLEFLPMPMVHWPDSMFTYCPERACLMCNDAFGQHLASSERFADEVGLDLAIEQTVVYFANILMPLRSQVAKAVAKVVEKGWALSFIAPSHGVIWRERDIPTVIDTYDRCCAVEPTAKVVVVYTTMWGSTDMLAREIADGAREAGADVHLFDLAATGYASPTRELLDAGAVLVGSSALHHGMHPRVAGYLQFLVGLRPTGMIAGAFGSFGWSSGATSQIEGRFSELGLATPFGDFTVKYRPAPGDLERARAWGASFGEAVVAGVESGALPVAE